MIAQVNQFAVSFKPFDGGFAARFAGGGSDHVRRAVRFLKQGRGIQIHHHPARSADKEIGGFFVFLDDFTF